MFSRDLLEIFIEFASASKATLEMIALKNQNIWQTRHWKTIMEDIALNSVAGRDRKITNIYFPRTLPSFWEEVIATLDSKNNSG